MKNTSCCFEWKTACPIKGSLPPSWCCPGSGLASTPPGPWGGPDFVGTTSQTSLTQSSGNSRKILFQEFLMTFLSKRCFLKGFLKEPRGKREMTGAHEPNVCQTKVILRDIQKSPEVFRRPSRTREVLEGELGTCSRPTAVCSPLRAQALHQLQQDAVSLERTESGTSH